MKKLLASVAMVAALTVPAAAQDADTVLATVNGKDITLGHLIAVTEGLSPQFQQLPDEQLFAGLLEQMVRQEALASSTRSNLSRKLSLALEAQEMALIANAIISQAIDVSVTEEALRAAYDEQYGNVEPTPEFNASHILVATEAEAQSLVEQLADGADFAELARTFSTGPSGPNGGNLGWFGPGQMVPPFEAAVLGLEVGGVSAPVETQFGWHVVTLNEKRDAVGPAFEEVRGQLGEMLSESAAQEVVESLTAAATIVRSTDEIDPALIRNTDLIAD